MRALAAEAHAVVVLWPGAGATQASDADLVEHARGLVAGDEAPTSVEPRAEPLPPAGARGVLERAPCWQGRQRGVDRAGRGTRGLPTLPLEVR